jgi:hypothetical protein
MTYSSASRSRSLQLQSAFLKRHRKDLLRVPVAVFGMGLRDWTEESWRRSRC